MRWIMMMGLMGCGGDAKPGDTHHEHTETDTDTDTDADTDTDTDTDAPWAHTIEVDGDGSEWLAEEAFATTGGTTWITWDADTLFVGVDHPDVAAGGSEHWIQIYLGTDAAGTTTGVRYNTQEPLLPVEMSHLIRVKADGSFDSLATWGGKAWEDTPDFLGTEGSLYGEGAIVELGIPFAAVGVGDTFAIHVNWLFEGGGYESSYAPVPAGSHADSYDPDYSQVFVFDRRLQAAPADAVPAP